MCYIMCKDSNKERVIPFGHKAKDALQKYMKSSRETMINDKHSKVLFVNCSGTPMSRQGFWKLIKYYTKKAGIEMDPKTRGPAVDPKTMATSAPIPAK